MSGNDKVEQGNFLGSGFNVEQRDCTAVSIQNCADSEALVVRNPSPNASVPAFSASPTVHLVLC